MRAIASTVERAPSTIARELARKTNALQDHGFHHAQQCDAACRCNAYDSGTLDGQNV